MASSKSHALALVNDTTIREQDHALAALQQSAINQHALIHRTNSEMALRSLFLGCVLLRIKASLSQQGRGKWMPWVNTFFPHVGQRQVNYYMAAALVFIEKAKVAKPELLALAGDQLDLALDGPDTTLRRFAEKGLKFIGELSFTELLDKHGLKGKKKLGGAREKAEQGDTPPAILTPEQLTAQAREEIASWLWLGRQLLILENKSLLLSESERGDIDASATALLSEWRKAIKKSA